MPQRDGINGVGLTALFTAATRAQESERPGALFHDPLARPLAGVEGFGLAGAGTASAGPSLYALRHRFFDDAAQQAAADGVHQLVLLAAGLDTRAFRLSWPDGMTIFEIDQPAVLAYKERVLAQEGATPGCSRLTVAADLLGSWESALLESGFCSDAPSAWIAEGLLFYLPEPSVSGLLATAAHLSSPGSRLATDTMGLVALTEPYTVWRESLSALGAPLRSVTDHPVELLAECGWKATAHTYGDLAHLYGTRTEIDGGHRILLATRGATT